MHVENPLGQALRFGYDNDLEPVYSIEYVRDPGIQSFLASVEKDVCLGKWRQATFSCLVMGVRCNKIMANALASDFRLESRLDDAQLDAILSKEGIMASATKLGNESVKDAPVSIKKLYQTFIEEDEGGDDGEVGIDLAKSWCHILSGEVEANKEMMVRWREEYDIFGFGEFKAYFIAKVLRNRFPRMKVRGVVGPNLRPDRGTGAFVELFDVKLSESQARADLDSLLQIVSRALVEDLRAMNQAALIGILDDEIVEHTLCEYFKALRIKRAWQASVHQACRTPASVHQARPPASVHQAGRTLHRHKTLGATPSGLTPRMGF